MSWIAPIDQEERGLAIAPSHSVHVEAPAGSGKTTVLLKRYLALLARVREPEEILAMTFTRKAAGELRARIQHELTKREEPGGTVELEPHEAELRDLALAAARRHADLGMSLLERLQVNTFHGFCAQLLRLIPQQAGLPPDFGLLDESASKRLQQETVARVGRRLRSLPAQDPVRQALVRRLVRLNNNWSRLADELQGLLSRRDILGDFIALARESRDPGAYADVLREHLSTMILPRLTRLAQEFGRSEIGRRWPELYRCLAEAGAGLAGTLPEAVPGASLEEVKAWGDMGRGLLTKKGECYKSFARPKFPQGFKDSPWGRLVQELPAGLVAKLDYFRELSPILLPEDEVAAVQDLIIVLHQALAAYEDLCSARRSLDFTGLEQVALRVLNDEDLPELFRRFDRRLTHLLVDEFQDTSVKQMHLLCRLLAGWQGDRGRSLMVVGDPKQSIYGWRQARLELFFQARDGKRLPSCPEAPSFKTLTLKTNFRSTEALVEWANEVFGRTIMADREESGVDFKAAVARPGADAGDPPGLALFTGPEARRQEAEWLAGELLQVCRRQDQKAPEARDTVGVLLFTRTHLATYLEAWRRAGLSLRVKDGLPLKDSLAVRHLHNLATALVHPHDDVAWAALLRGWAGPQPLGLLAEVASGPGDFWSEKIRRYAADRRCPSAVSRMYKGLAVAGQRLGREPLEATLEACLVGIEGWEKIASWEGPQGVANARSYLEKVAGAAGATPETTLAEVKEVLAEAYQPPDPRAQDSPIEVSTVHAAKGLEYDRVFLPFADWQPLMTRRNDAPFLMEEVAGTGTAVIALNRAYVQTEQSILYQSLKATSRQRTLGEARRLFYVAVTRARKRLQMSGVINRDKEGEWKYAKNSPLGWLWQHYDEAALHPGVVNLWPEPQLLVTVSDEMADWIGEEAVRGAGVLDKAAGVEVQRESLKGESRRQETDLGGNWPDFRPEPYEVHPEPWPYELRFPSQLAAETQTEGMREVHRVVEAAARVRGEISHRLLEILSLGGVWPEPEGVASALRQAVPDATAALNLAREILAEIKACRADPFLAPLLEPDLPVARSEWLVEAWAVAAQDGDQGMSLVTLHPSRGEGNKDQVGMAGGKLKSADHWPALYRGQIDRLVFDGGQWWLLDYKTSRPAAGVDWELFIQQETEKYRPQLLAYREMAARFFGVEPPEAIKAVLYFTACQRHVIL